MVIFANNKTYNAIGVYAGEITLQGAHRRTLDICVSKNDATFEELSELYSNTEALDSITTVDNEDSSISNLHLHYIIPVSLGLKDLDGEQVWSMKVAEISALELAQAVQAADIANHEAALIELAEIIAGGAE